MLFCDHCKKPAGEPLPDAKKDTDVVYPEPVWMVTGTREELAQSEADELARGDLCADCRRKLVEHVKDFLHQAQEWER